MGKLNPVAAAGCPLVYRKMWALGVAFTIARGAPARAEPETIPYEIQRGQWEKTPVEQIWKAKAFQIYRKPDGETVSFHRFDLWDLNGDQRADLVEVRNSRGVIERQVFDFDFDGLPDYAKRLRPMDLK